MIKNEYERLTEWVGEGNEVYAIARPDIRYNGDRRCLIRLAEYEDLGYSPEELKGILEEQEKQNMQERQDKCQVRPGMRILCRTAEEAHLLLMYLGLYGYLWPDGTKLHWQDNFFGTWGGTTAGTSYSVYTSASNGDRHVRFGMPEEDDIPFAELGLNESVAICCK